MTTNPDFHYVAPEQKAIDARLDNWSRYVQVKPQAWVSPIWMLGKSNGRQWEEPQYRPACDTLDGSDMEIAVRALPELHREAVRWCYVYKCHPAEFCRVMGIRKTALMQYINDGRRMLINRRV